MAIGFRRFAAINKPPQEPVAPAAAPAVPKTPVAVVTESLSLDFSEPFFPEDSPLPDIITIPKLTVPAAGGRPVTPGVKSTAAPAPKPEAPAPAAPKPPADRPSLKTLDPMAELDRMMTSRAPSPPQRPVESAAKPASSAGSSWKKLGQMQEPAPQGGFAEVKKAAPKARKAPESKPLDMAKFGLNSEAEWLLVAPSRYEDYKNVVDDFSQLYQGNARVVMGRVKSIKLYDDKGKETTNPRFGSRLAVKLVDKRGRWISCGAFGRPGFAWKGISEGDMVHVYGMPKINPRFNELNLEGVEPVAKSRLGKIEPVYPAIKQTKGERFGDEVSRHWHMFEIASALVDAETGWSHPNPVIDLKEITHFKDATTMLQELHEPSSVDMGEKARRAARLVSALSLVRKTQMRVAAVEANPKSIVPIRPDTVEELIQRIPFPMTSDQKDAIDGICKSLKSPMPMSGLLTGDVGSGKTLSFLIPMVAAQKAGKHVMLMTPNLLLIQQVANEMKTFFPEVPVCVVTGKGGVKGEEKGSFMIGNTALIHAFKKEKLKIRPDFLVIDEQHKFSVEQREMLRDKHTNILEATATPIPRTAALATHGTKDLFTLHEIPVDKRIDSEILIGEEMAKGRKIILDALARGEQAAVIYPLVATDDPAKLATAVTNATHQWDKDVSLEHIAILHGKMKDDEKEAVLNSFRSGEKKLLLSSTVVEVGVTLPELKTMMVVGADTLGVVSLHQLRGRLARKGGVGHFMMHTDNPEAETMERLELVAQYNDGFILADKDAEIRGYGDLLGIDGDSQSGGTRTLFMGVKVGPREISFAANLYEKFAKLESASLAADVASRLKSQMSANSQKALLSKP